MDIREILLELPPTLSRSLQLKLEDCSVSTHLTEDEAREIVNDVVLRLRAEAVGIETNSDLEPIFSSITDAVVETIFN